MKTHRLKQALSDEEAAQLAGTFLDDSHYDLIVDGDEECVDEKGEIILSYRKDAISPALCNQAYEALRHEKGIFTSSNRVFAGGSMKTAEGEVKIRVKMPKRDGTLSNTNVAARPTQSGIIGYFDRTPRYPYCRQTVFTANRVKQWRSFLPYAQRVSKVFSEAHPKRFSAQKDWCDRTTPEFIIPGSVFTTVTVNRNWQTAVHTDRGDLPEGFGVLTTFRAGRFKGGLFVLPKYRVAVNIQTGGVLLVNVHEWHGNTKLRGLPGSFERMSCVFYYRKKMVECGTPKIEGERARLKRGGLKAHV